jgi:Zn-dependent membrane protease YugP
MFFYGRYFDPLYLTITAVSLALMLAAQFLVKSRYSKYSKIINRSMLTGAEAARRVLEANGVYNVAIEKVAGRLSDHYDPRANVIRLSAEVYDSPSIASVGIASHEAGHAVQYAKKYVPIKLRMAIIPFAQHGPIVGIMLMLIGVAINMFNLTLCGLILFGATFVFQFITLPVEFNASRRAIEAIKSENLLSPDEAVGAKKVLGAAAMTYVAAMIQSFLLLLYYAVRFLGGSRRD